MFSEALFAIDHYSYPQVNSMYETDAYVVLGCRVVFESVLRHSGIDLILSILYTDKKENKIFLIYKEIQSGAVAKS